LVVLSSLFILIGCSGSPKIQGKWNVQDASGEQKTIEIKDKKYIDEVYKNFDPFLSYKNRVKVRFTEKELEFVNEKLKKTGGSKPDALLKILGFEI